jgi:hypothetical protein
MIRPLILTLLLASCGKDPELIVGEIGYQAGKLNPVTAPLRDVVVDAELASYVTESGISVGFYTEYSDNYGVCIYHHNMQTKEILINRETWYDLSECMKRMVMKHEINHCVYQIAHTETGLMAPQIDSKELCNEETE